MKLQVPVTKAKATIDIDSEELPDDVYAEALLQGLKVLVNRGTTKINKTLYADPDELVAAAMAKAEEQVELIKTSKIRFTGSKVKKASGAVMTEARRIARTLVKDAMKAQGLKISHYAASEITKAANELLASEEGETIMKTAEENIAARQSQPIKLDLTAIMDEDPEKVAKAEQAKAKKRKGGEPLSATQAGIPAKRKKGKQDQPTAE